MMQTRRCTRLYLHCSVKKKELACVAVRFASPREFVANHGRNRSDSIEYVHVCVCVCVHACVYLHRVFGSRLVLEKRSSLVQAGEKRTFNKYFFYDNLVAAAYNLKRVRRSARGGIESIVDWETGGIISFRMVV